MKRLLLSLCACVAFTTQASQFAIVGAKVHTMTAQGTLEEATVLIKDGVIQDIIMGDDAPRGYEQIDGAGKVVTPGLIGAFTALGLKEVGMSAGQIDSSVDAHHIEDFTSVGAALDVSFAINPDSTLIPISRIEGFTAAATNVERSEFMFKGQGSIMQLSDDDPLIKPRAFMTLDLSNSGADSVGGTRAVMWPMLIRTLREAMRYDPTEEHEGLLTEADVAALSEVVSGNVPLLIRADRKADILQVINLAEQFKRLDIVIVSGLEAWRVADKLAKADIPVILDPEYNLPGGFDRLGATLANAGRLAKAGVTVAIGMETHNIRLATQHAGNAVANGMPYADALAALTTNVAKIYRLDDQMGMLKPGMRADVVVWSGDPLEVTEAPEHVFIAGEPVEMRSRQTELRDRYMQLDKTIPMQHVRN